MAIYKRGSMWHADFTVAGRRYRRALKTSNWREAQHLEKDEIRKAGEGKLIGGAAPFARLTFEEAAEKHISEREPRLAPKTAVCERERAKAVSAKLGNLKPGQLSVDKLQAYIAQRRAEGMSAGTINRELDVIRGVLKRAKLWAALAEDVKPLPIVRDYRTALVLEQKVKLLKAARLRPEWQCARLAMTLALNTTMRACEIRGLRWKDVDLLDRSLTVRRSKTDAGQRIIPLNGEGYEAVMELRARAQDIFGVNPDPDWYLFARGAGATPPRKKEREPIPKIEEYLQPLKSWRTAWRHMTKAAGLSGFRFHDLRHQAISELSEGGASEQTIMAIAGHVSRQMLEHYSHPRMKAKRAALDALAGKKRSHVTSHVTKSEKTGGRHGIRTHGLLVANEALSQLS
jgi:integrase